MTDQTEREALTEAFGVSNGSHVWLEFQGGPDEMLAMLHAAGFRRIDPTDEALVRRLTAHHRPTANHPATCACGWEFPCATVRIIRGGHA